MSISEDEAREMFHDRIRFKFHCAVQHLNNLKSFAEAKDAEGNKEFYNKTYGIRIKWEDETECVLFHLIGALDALLLRMNEKFGFGLLPCEINLKKIVERLSKEHKDLRSLLKPAVEGTDWLYCLIKLRNMGTHRNSLNVIVARSIGDDSIPQITSLRYAPDIDVISFLDESLHKMKQLICGIVEKEADLKFVPE
jgi:hypothetical protein